MKVLKLETKVVTVVGNIEGRISEILITFSNKPFYNIEMFFDCKFSNIWLYEEQFLVVNKEYKTIGFRP